MSFNTSVTGNVWTQSPSGKGGRRELVKKGVYVIDHRDTGRFIIGSSSNVSKDVDSHLNALAKGKHSIKHLQNQWDQEIQRSDKPVNTATFTITEYPLSSEKAIKQTLKEIRESNTTPYCLLN